MPVEHAAEEEPSSAHVAASHERRGEEKPPVEMALDQVHVLPGRDAPEQDHAVRAVETRAELDGVRAPGARGSEDPRR